MKKLFTKSNSSLKLKPMEVSRWSLLLGFLFLGSVLNAQVDGATCEAPVAVDEMPYSDSGNTSTYGNNYTSSDVPDVAPDAVTNGTGTTSYLNGNEVVYSYTAGADGSITIDTTNDSDWIGLWVFTGCPFDSTVGYHVTTSGATRSVPNLPVEEGETYYIVISTWPAPQSTDYTLSITGTNIADPPTCPKPKSLTLNSASTDEAEISWTAGDEEEEWEVFFGEAGFDVETEGETFSVSNDPDIQLTDLTPNTNYEVYVSAICDENDISTLSGPLNFFTTCIASDIPFLQDFESVTTPDIPNCGSIETLAGGQDWATTDDIYGLPDEFDGNVLYFHYTSSSDGAADAWYFTQGIELEAGEEYQISYKYSNNSTSASYTEKLKVAYGSSPEASAMDNELMDHPDVSGQVVNTSEVVFTADEDGVYYFGFQAYSDANQYYLFVDDIFIDFAPTCFKPTDLAVDETMINSADISWTAENNEDEWEVVYGETGFDVENEGESITVADDPNVTLTDLMQNTVYDFYVKAICSEDDESYFAGPMTFTTDCGTASVPYVLDFEQADVPDLPNCTTHENNGAVGNDWKTRSSATNFDGKVLNYSYHSYLNPGAANSWFYTQGIELEAGESYDISYKYGNNSTSYTESMKVAYGTSAEEAAMTNELADYPEIQLTTPEEALITFTVDTDGIYYFGFNAYSIENQNQLYLDDIQIDFTPSCPVPSDLTVSNITEDTADLAWTDNAEADQWEVIYGETDFDVETEGTTVTANDDPEITLTDLTENTQYDFYVKAICATDDESTLAGPASFTTACDPITEMFEDFESYGTGNIVPDCWERLEPETSAGSQTITTTSPASGVRNIYQNTSSTANSIIVVLPKFSNIDAGTHWLRLQARVSSGAPGSLSVGYVTDASDYSSFTSIEDLSITNTSYGDDSEYTIVVPTSVPDNARLAIKNDNDGKSYYWDDVYWEEAPSCLAPSNLEVSNISLDSADITWTEQGTATEWEVIYGEAGFDVESEGQSIMVDDDSNKTLTDLSSNTSYDVYVKTICGTDDESELTGPITFHTDCLAADIPFTQDFEEVTPPDIPNCASLETNNGEGWETYEQTLYGFDSNVLRHRWTSIGSGPVDAWYFTQGINLEAGVNYQISYLIGSNSSSLTEKLKVAYGSSANSAAMTEELEDHEFTFSTAQEHEITFSVDTDGVYYFGFQSHSDENQYWLYLDDIHIDVAPTCIKPSDLAISDVGNSSATISWEGSADNYDYAVTTEDEEPTEADDSTTETTVDLEDLDEGTTYYIWVRSNCGDNDYSDWIVDNFTTTKPGEVCADPLVVDALPYTDSGNTSEYGDNYSSSDIPEVADGAITNGSSHIYYLNGDEAVYAYTPDVDQTLLVTAEEVANYSGILAFTGCPFDSTVGYHVNGFSGGDLEIEGLPVEAGETYYFVISTWASPQSTDYTIHIEEITCPAPVDVSVDNIEAFQADISWTAADGQDEWEVLYGEAGFDTESEGESVLVEATSYTIEELDPETEYDVYVRSVCGENYSDWVGPETFTTEEEPVEECIAPTDVEITDITETTAEVSWTAGADEDQWEVLYGETGFDTDSEGESVLVDETSYTITELDPETEYDVYVRAVCDVDNLSDWTGPETFTTAEEPVEECEAPTDVEVIDVTPTTAEVTWTAGGDENMWSVIYGLSGFTQEDEDDYEVELVFETNYVMTDLEPETDYDVYIVAVCDAEEMIVSDQVGPVIFTTEEMSVDSQEFNNFTFYPNPVEEQLSLKAGTQIDNVQVYNLLGQQVIGVQPNSLEAQIDTETLQSGVYLMEVSINGSQKTFRVVKK